jgi:RNA polymerase sigma-70 factor (ECF subfamily)
VWPLVRGLASRCLPTGEAEDAAQEALLRIFFRASEFDPKRDALAWVLGIAAWQVRTHRTRASRRREEPLPASEDSTNPGRSPEDDARGRELARELDRALAELSPSDAATLLAYARGERPNVPGATFRKRVERALDRLRSRWRIPHDNF